MDNKNYNKPEISVININATEDIIKTSNDLVSGTVSGSTNYSEGAGMEGGSVGGFSVFKN